MSTFESIGFIGGGRVTRFLLHGWRRVARMPPHVRVSDAAPDVLSALKADFPTVETVDHVSAARSSLVVLAVHPPAMADVLAGIKDVMARDATVLSLAPKVTMAALQHALGATAVARIIPNAPSAIGDGYNPVVFAPGFPGDARAALTTLFAAWGESPEVPERDLEAYAMLSAMGPTYLWFQWQTLRELAAEFGLTAQATDHALRSTVRGALDLLLSDRLTPAEVMNMVPVKPLKDDEAAFVAAYRARLPALYAKIRP